MSAAVSETAPRSADLSKVVDGRDKPGHDTGTGASAACCGGCGGNGADGRDASLSSWPGSSGPSVAARAGMDGRDGPGHDAGMGGCDGAGAGACGGACAGKGAADHAPTATYQNRRGELVHYLDRTAVDAWKRMTSDAPVNRIRATVRAGRDEIRST